MLEHRHSLQLDEETNEILKADRTDKPGLSFAHQVRTIIARHLGGVVDEDVYQLAVKGRGDFRDAYRAARDRQIDAAERAQGLCVLIEAIPASDEQAAAFVAASELRQLLARRNSGVPDGEPA